MVMATTNSVGKKMKKVSRSSIGKANSVSAVEVERNNEGPTGKGMKRGKGKGKERAYPPPIDARNESDLPSQGGKGGISLNTSSNRQQTIKAVSSDSNLVPVEPKLLNRFYEALVMLPVLGKNRGNRTAEIDFDMEPEASDLGPDKLRRSFIRHLAYLCDYEKGGDRTTAIALEQTPQGITYWVASNKTPETKSCGKDRIERFLYDMLDNLGSSSDGGAHQVELAIFEKSVSFSQSRILEYSKLLNSKLNLVLDHPSLLDAEEESSLKKWLQDLQKSCDRPQELCQLCYDIASSEQYQKLHLRTAAGAPCAGAFEDIRHTIGRLNHTLKASKIIVAASTRLPHLFHDFKVMRRKSSCPLPPPLQRRDPTLAAIAGRMLPDHNQIAEYREALKELDQKFNLSSELHRQCISPNWKPRVHAELILLDWFWTQDLEFVAGDRYIGCSKPACYCCSHYIKAHPGRFVIPACHNNTYLNWRAPDILDPKDSARIKIRQDILNEMNKKIRIDVLAQIMERRGPGKWKPDSMTEISSLRLGIPQFSSVKPEPYVSLDWPADESSECNESDSMAGNDEEYEIESEAGTESTEEEDSDGGVFLANSSSL